MAKAAAPPKPTKDAEVATVEAPPAAPCLPCPPSEETSAFPSHFARLFFGVITLLVLYYSYLIIKPYLLDIFMALVLFFTARPLYAGLCRLLWQRKVLASGLTCLILLIVILTPLFSLMGIAPRSCRAAAAEYAISHASPVAPGLAWPARRE